MNFADLFQNNPLDTDSYDDPNTEHESNNGNNKNDNNTQYGGNDDIPNGGFLPIYICNKEKVNIQTNDDDKSKREYKTHKTAVSIKQILEKRRENTPFIKI